jgi:hypothetical protein
VERKDAFTSSRDAASRSSIGPIVLWWYGWPSGKIARQRLGGKGRPDGRLSVRPALLALDDLAGCRGSPGWKRVEERAHPIRLEPQRDLDLVRRHVSVVPALQPRRPLRLPRGDWMGATCFGRRRAPSPGTSRARTGGRSRSCQAARASIRRRTTRCRDVGRRWSSGMISRRPFARREVGAKPAVGRHGYSRCAVARGRSDREGLHVPDPTRLRGSAGTGPAVCRTVGGIDVRLLAQPPEVLQSEPAERDAGRWSTWSHVTAAAVASGQSRSRASVST